MILFCYCLFLGLKFSRSNGDVDCWQSYRYLVRVLLWWIVLNFVFPKLWAVIFCISLCLAMLYVKFCHRLWGIRWMKKDCSSLEKWQVTVCSGAIKQSDVISGMIEVSENNRVCQKTNSAYSIKQSRKMSLLGGFNL